MSRTERRLIAREMRKQADAWPERLALMPESQWPQTRPPGLVAVWRSRRYLVQQYAEAPFLAVEVRRLTVNRTTRGNGGDWEQNIPWDDLQRLKRETGHGDWYAIEIFPRDRDVVNDANMRHLWLLAEPLAIGWFEDVDPT